MDQIREIELTVKEQDIKERLARGEQNRLTSMDNTSLKLNVINSNVDKVKENYLSIDQAEQEYILSKNINK